MFVKHFVRMLTREELSDQEVIVYYDIVQSIVETKLLTAYDEKKSKVGVEVRHTLQKIQKVICGYMKLYYKSI